MLAEQNKLEEQFAILVAEQPSLRNLPNKNKLIENQQKVLAVTEKLRLGTQALCRNLKVCAMSLLPVMQWAHVTLHCTL